MISWNILQEISTLEYFTPDHSFQFGKRKQNTNRLYVSDVVSTRKCSVFLVLVFAQCFHNMWCFRVYSEFLFIPHFWFLTVFLKNNLFCATKANSGYGSLRLACLLTESINKHENKTVLEESLFNIFCPFWDFYYPIWLLPKCSVPKWSIGLLSIHTNLISLTNFNLKKLFLKKPFLKMF